MEPRIQYAKTSDGVNIAFWSMGEGLPLVHMPPQPWSHIELEWQDPDYRRWYERLLHGKRVIRYDNRGSGLSDRKVSDYSLDAHIADLDAVADRLHLDAFVLAGISPSSPIAVAYAARRPRRVSQLVLWCPVVRSKDIRLPSNDAISSLRQTDYALFTETIAHAMVAGWAAGEAARKFAALMRQAADSDIAAVADVSSWDLDLTDELPRIQCPTLILQRKEASYPPVDSTRYVAARIPDSQLVILDGGALLPFVGDMESVVRTIDEFLGVAAGEPEPPAPSTGGLATILFTDVEGSTALTERLGDAAARDVLREHERITREALRSHGGAEVKTMGDGFMASFGSATGALECAIALQRAFAGHNVGVGAQQPATGIANSPGGPVVAAPLQVRIGLNAGEPIAEGDDLFGTAVITAARIAAQAQGGEILVSDVVRQLVAGKGFLFADRGETVLRGFEDPVRVYEVRWRES